VFLSPPWGGIKYKDSGTYNIRELMTPNIYDIIKTSLSLAPNIIFFLPRTLVMDDLLEILYTVLLEKNIDPNKIFLDIHILKSGNKIKALLIFFGPDCETEISQNDMKEYLCSKYDFSNETINKLLNIIKVIGNFQFLHSECMYHKQHCSIDENFEENFLKYFYKEILTEYQMNKLKLLEKKAYYTLNSLLFLKSLKLQNNNNNNIKNIPNTVGTNMSLNLINKSTKTK
jgi:hypothetical protein